MCSSFRFSSSFFCIQQFRVSFVSEYISIVCDVTMLFVIDMFGIFVIQSTFHKNMNMM